MQFLNTLSPSISVFLGTRAAGKTGGLAYRVYQRISMMPRGHFFLGASTLEQLKNKIVPNVFKLLKIYYNLSEGTDYVLYKKPPKNFVEPIEKPDDYSIVISWSNGSWTELVSYRKREANRGANFDGGDFDEGLLWTWAAISGIFIPAMRGNKHRFAKCPLHYNISIYSSLPRTPEGMYLMNFESKHKANPKTFFYIFATWRDNKKVLGEDYGQRMKAQMEKIEYQIEIEGELNIKTGEEYYWAFDFFKHGYITSKGFMGHNNKREYNPNQQFDLTFDFGANFSCMLVMQVHGLEIRCIDSLHVKFEQKLHALIKNFCDKYNNHNNKHVNLYGEPFGMKQREDNQPLFIQVQEQLKQFGWTSIIYVGKYDKAAKHKERYKNINNVLSESDQFPFLPVLRINRETCEDPIIALQRTKIKDDFTKNKNEEKHPRKYNQAHAPHFTDALDNYIRQKFTAFPTLALGSGNAGVT